MSIVASNEILQLKGAYCSVKECLRRVISRLLFLYAFSYLFIPTTAVAQQSTPQELVLLIKQLVDSDADNIANARFDLGKWYAKEGVQGKSIEYFQLAAGRQSNLSLELRLQALQAMGKQYEELEDYSNALDAYKRLLSLVSTQERYNYLPRMAEAYQLSNQPEKALDLRKEQLQVVQRKSEQPSMELLASLGELCVETGQYSLGQSFFKQAAASTNEEHWKKRFLVSQAVAAVKSHNINQARLLTSQLSPPITLPDARAYQDLAYAYYCMENYQKAIVFCQTALDSSTSGSDNTETQIDLYRLLKLTYEALGNYRQAVTFSQKYLSLENDLKLQAEEKRQEFLRKEVEAARTEGIIRDFLARQEAQVSALERERLEKEKKERELALRRNELDLLKQEELVRATQIKQQQLEREQIEQRLKYAEQEALAIAQRQEAERQAAKAKEKELLAEKEQAERIRQEKALEVVKKEQELQSTLLDKERSKQLYYYFFFGLIAVVVLLLIRSARMSKKAQRNLQQKSAEISRKNQKLLQVQQALQQEQEATKAQNKALEEQQSLIQSSLNYALNIQGAILPSHRQLAALFSSYFVIFKPKDVVSGDFYWTEQLPDGSRFVATIDCTGHGIPGAFMSMIGHTLMNELLLTEGLTQPSQILTALHEKVQIALHQKESQNRDGMDVCACWITPEKDGEDIAVHYSGARIPLYYHHAQEGFKYLAGTKRSLGGEQMPSKNFEEHRISLPKGSVLYLTTDGITDQSNPERKRFGRRRLVDLLKPLHGLPLEEQCSIIGKALEGFQQQEAQRDDMTMLAVQL